MMKKDICSPKVGWGRQKISYRMLSKYNLFGGGIKSEKIAKKNKKKFSTFIVKSHLINSL